MTFPNYLTVIFYPRPTLEDTGDGKINQLVIRMLIDLSIPGMPGADFVSKKKSPSFNGDQS